MSATIQELIKASESLKAAHGLLKRALDDTPENIELHKALRDSCIQRFEFCVELSWKISIKLLGLDTKAPNPAIRDMAQNHLIDNPQIWFDFLIARNKTSHTYNEDVAKEVYRATEQLVPELEELLNRLARIK